MPTTDRVNAPASDFLDGDGVTLWDLAYEEWVRWFYDGAATRHVERYYAQLAIEEGAQQPAA
jgi:hypothetical protein